MKPVVLLVGRLPSVVDDVVQSLGDLPIEWLAAHDRDEVARQLDAEPNIVSVVIGAGLDDTIRGDLIGVIASRRPDVHSTRSGSRARQARVLDEGRVTYDTLVAEG